MPDDALLSAWNFRVHRFFATDAGLGLAVAYKWPVWAAIVSALVTINALQFSVVHNIVDTRTCTGYLPDPLYQIIAFDERWTFVTRVVYQLVGALVAGIAIVQAIRGAHAVFLRWALGLSVMALVRIGTLLLFPVCQATVKPFGPPPLASPEMLNLHFFSIPWRPFAMNDLMFSGHTALFVLLLLASTGWPAMWRASVAAFLGLQAYALLAAREHYTLDIAVALPISIVADAIGVILLRKAATRFGIVTSATTAGRRTPVHASTRTSGLAPAGRDSAGPGAG